MPTNIFIFHGTSGHPQENWFPWLKQKMEANDCKIFIPQFPTPEGQSAQAWFKILQNFETQIDKNAILIGHSLGGLFLLHLLQKLEKPVRMAVFVATPIGEKPIKNYESDKAFNGFSFDWPAIQSKAQTFAVFHSDDDPYVSLANGKKLAKKLDTNLTFIPKAGHFNTAAGYTKFEILKDMLTTKLN